MEAYLYVCHGGHLSFFFFFFFVSHLFVFRHYPLVSLQNVFPFHVPKEGDK